MTLKHYFPLSVVVFVLVIAAVRAVSIPILPFVLVLLVGATMLGFQLEDHKVSRLLRTIFRAAKSDHGHH